MNAAPRRDAKWWGWGDPEILPELGPEALRTLREELGDLRPGAPVPDPGAVALPDPRPLPEALAAAAGAPNVLTGHEDRLRHAAGKGYRDLARLRSGSLDAAPDAVVLPEDSAQIVRIIEVCAAEGVAVVPFGGGTSVVGGVEPIAGDKERVIALDLARLRRVSADRRSLTARLGAGLRGPEAEAALARDGLTIGHFPQSFEYATIGGFAATRSAGQSSSGYGRFDSLVTAVRMLAPAGEVSTLATPHSAAGPSLRELVLGSEGTLGVIPEVTVKVRPAPDHRRYEAWIAESFDSGTEIVRTMAQGGALPDVVRLSDEEETRVSLALSGPSGVAGSLFDAYLTLRRRRGGCLLVVGIEGDAEAVARRRALAVRELRRGGAAYLGQGAGRSWERGRYRGPYLRDTLMSMGALVETLETSQTWSRLGALYRRVGGAIRSSLAGQGTPGIVFCHVSHAYPDGASLYFTFIARSLEGREVEQWAEVKRAACEAIVAEGGTITHHHAVGSDHAPYMEAEVGAAGLGALRALKESLDPAGIMNPGKLFP
ncbi:MAG: FAD-binding oxidoreductase [Solirubrobacterales bacterium]